MPDHDAWNHLAKVLDLFGKGPPRIIGRNPNNLHTQTHFLTPEEQATVNAAREALKKHGRQ